MARMDDERQQDLVLEKLINDAPAFGLEEVAESVLSVSI